MMVCKLRVPSRVVSALGVIVVLVIGPGVALGQATPSPQTAAETSSQKQACPKLPGKGGFADRIDNRYLPLAPGTIFTYRETADGEVLRDVVEVTRDTKVILGIKTVVVNDTTTDRHGDPVEKTLDWYAQDKDGNVWYFGEDTKEYKNGRPVSTKGSWQAGVHGAKPGIVMEAHPRVGDTYQQECAAGVAEDAAKVLQLNQSVTVPYGTFHNVLVTKDFTPLEPKVVEQKSYAPCIGLVRAVMVEGGKEESVLVDVKGGSGGAGTQSKCGA